MSESAQVSWDRLRWRCDPAVFDFDTTAELSDAEAAPGQERALAAVEFGVDIRRAGYNIFALGPPGTGKRTLVERLLRLRAAGEPPPADWCYVHDFLQPQSPRAVRLPAGRGKEFHRRMKGLVDELRSAIPAALQSEECRSRIEEVEREFKQRHDEEFSRLAQEADAEGIRLVRTPGGFALAPLVQGEVVSPEQFEKLPQADRERIETLVASFQERLQAIIEQIPEGRRLARDRIREIQRDVTGHAISHALETVRQAFSDLPAVLAHLEAVEQDVLTHADDFRPIEEDSSPAMLAGLEERPSFRRYEANLLVDHSEAQGAPLIFEDFPSLPNLVGRIEHQTQLGALVTDFSLIKAGALHRANGGYLVLEARKLLSQPYAWEGLKRALQTGRVKIESLGEALSLISTVSLEAEPIPLDAKVVLLGDRQVYYLLCEFDPEFAELFKVSADFDDRMVLSAESCRRYGRFLGGMARREGLRPFDRSAVAAALEQAARVAEDSERLSTHLRTLHDLLREADYWAGQDGAATAAARHVERAIAEQIGRADRIRRRVQEEIERGAFLVDCQGERVGQINGLSVIDLGNFRFGRPTRITATARLGKGEVVDIEREVELGGALHSKGVLILSHFLAARYAADGPLAVSASLAFEQSYGPVEGDSASLAELCAVLSAVSGLPLRQTLAATGSVNQLGQVQAIGGVNEKIEGFFDLCQARGLTDDQGVLIPSANVPHLMLRSDVVAAVAAGRFQVYAVERVDQALPLLTGRSAGERGPDGTFPPDSVNGLVAARLADWARLRRELDRPTAAPREPTL